MRVALVSLLVLWCASCGETSHEDDATVDGGAEDGGSNACARPELSLPCCAMRSNADRLDAAQLVMTSIDFTRPEGFRDNTFRFPLVEALQTGRWTWLFEVRAPLDGSPTLVTGAGNRVDDASGAYLVWTGDAPDLPADRYARRELTATLDADTMMTTERAPIITFPIRGFSSLETLLEIELRDLAIDRLVMTEMRTCVGEPSAIPLMWRFNGSELSGFLTIEAARGQLSPGIGTELCEAMAGTSCDAPREMWPRPPDSRCTEDGCAEGGCDPLTECDAYRVEARFGAVGADVR